MTAMADWFQAQVHFIRKMTSVAKGNSDGLQHLRLPILVPHQRRTTKRHRIFLGRPGVQL